MISQLHFLNIKRALANMHAKILVPLSKNGTRFVIEIFTFYAHKKQNERRYGLC